MGFNFSATLATGGSWETSVGLDGVIEVCATNLGLKTIVLFSRGWFLTCTLGVLETATRGCGDCGGETLQADTPKTRTHPPIKSRKTDEKGPGFWDLKRPDIGEGKGVSLRFLRNDRKRPLVFAAFKKSPKLGLVTQPLLVAVFFHALAAFMFCDFRFSLLLYGTHDFSGLLADY